MLKQSFIKELFNRRIPQIIGSYIVAGTSLVLFIDWLVNRYAFPQYYVTLALVSILSIIPSVIIIAYFHGAPGKDEWTKIERVGIPINIIFIALILFFGYFYDWWLYKIPELDDYSNIYISKIFSNQNNEYIFEHPLLIKSFDVDVYAISSDSLENLYSDLIQYAISKFYPTRMVYNSNDIKDKYIKLGQIIPYIDEKTVPMWAIAYKMIDSTKSMQNNFDSIWKIKKKIKFDLGVYIHLYGFKSDGIENFIVIIDYNTNEHDGYALIADTFISTYEDFPSDVVDNIYNKILKITVQKDLEAEVIEHNNNQVLLKYSGKTRLLKNTIMTGYRNYELENKFDVRIKDIEDFESYCNSLVNDTNSYDYCTNILNNKYDNYIMSYDELEDLKKGMHKLFFSDKNIELILPLNIDFKIITVYDTTAVAVETKPSWIKLNKGDILRVK